MSKHREHRWPNPLPGHDQAVWFGGDYNPDQWPERVWDEDIELMEKAKVNIVTLAVFSWARIEPEDGVYDFDWLDRIIDKLGQAGIAVDLATATASPPKWLTDAHPEVLWEDEYGHVCQPGGRQHWRATSPVFRGYALELCKRMAEHYKTNPYVVSWHVNNEYGCHNRFDYSDDAKKAFQSWCRKRYGDIETLNEAWGNDFWAQRLTSFDQIDPPRFIGEGNFNNPGRMLDFKRFCSDALKDFFVAERDTLAAITPDKPLTTNFMVSASGVNLDYADWGGEVDFVSNDHYFTPGDQHFDELAYSASLVDNIAGRKPWFLMEQSTGAVNWRNINYSKEPGQLVRDSLGHLASGADAICYFQWRQSQAGAEKFHSAMLPHAGKDSRIFKDVCELGDDLQLLGNLGLVGTVPTSSPVAVLFDYPSEWATEHTATPSRLLRHWPEPLEWFRAFADIGIHADVVPLNGQWETHRIVVLPCLYSMDASQVSRIRQFVRRGGRIIATYGTGIVDERDHIWLGGYPGSIKDVLGVSGEEFVPLGDDFPGCRDHVNIDNGTVARRMIQPVSFMDAETEILARYQAPERTGLNGTAAVTVHPFGTGSAAYIGCSLTHNELASILSDILASLDSDVHGCGGDGALMRIERSDGNGGNRFLFTFNRADHPVFTELRGDPIVSSLVTIDDSTKKARMSENAVLVEHL